MIGLNQYFLLKSTKKKRFGSSEMMIKMNQRKSFQLDFEINFGPKNLIWDEIQTSQKRN